MSIERFVSFYVICKNLRISCLFILKILSLRVDFILLSIGRYIIFAVAMRIFNVAFKGISAIDKAKKTSVKDADVNFPNKASIFFKSFFEKRYERYAITKK